MLAVRRSSCYNHRWSSILRSSFTCTFLLPSFFSYGDTARRRDGGGERRFFTAADRRRGHGQFSTRNPSMRTPNGSVQYNYNPNLLFLQLSHFSTTPPISSKKFKIKPNWITNLKIAFPERPPEEDPPPTPSPLHHPGPKRFHLHGDLLADHKFPYLFGFWVPLKPAVKNPRYEEAWLASLLTGPFLPPGLRAPDSSSEPPCAEKLLLFLERARGHNQDVLTELVASGKWQQAVWIVRRLIEPGFSYPADTHVQSAMEGVKYTPLASKAPEDKSGGIPSHAVAGRSGLWTVEDVRVKHDIERRRRGFGVVLGGLAGMVLRAGERVRSASGTKDGLGDQHTDLLPTVRQILAYLHTEGLIPEGLYAADRYPRLHVLRSRILASLADAAWHAQEAMVAEEAARLGIVGEYRGMEVPRARYRLEVWGSGTKDISSRPKTAGLSPEKAREVEWGTYAEREVWLELILTIIVEAGYGNTGVNVVKTVLAMNSINNRWQFIDYRDKYPSEYTHLAISKFPYEPKTGIAERWALEGHSLVPPPITTHPLTLPDWILPSVADAVIDSTAEGRGLESMFTTLLTYARTLPIRKETLLRLLRHPALIWSKNPSAMEIGAGLLWDFGNPISAIDMYNSALTLYIHADNLPGAQRLWTHILKTQHIMKTPTPILGHYLIFLVRHRRLTHAWNLLRHNPTSEPTHPIIPENAYISPAIAPGLLALAVASQSRALYTKLTSAFKYAIQTYGPRARVTRGMYTSLLNAQLSFRDYPAAKQTLLSMSSSGIQTDGVVVAVLVEHELRRDPESGYRLVEEAEAGRGVSQDAWRSVLTAAVERGEMGRVEWALGALGVERTGRGADEVVVNILLKGVARREGAEKAMGMWKRFYKHGGGDAKSVRVVLHQAIREGLRIKERWEREITAMRRYRKWKDGRKGRRVRRKVEAKMKRVNAVVDWCWGELRTRGMEVGDTEKVVRVRLRRRAKRKF